MQFRDLVWCLAVALVRPIEASPWSLKDRHALITGGSKGIGRGIVDEFLGQGCIVLTCARDTAPLQDLCSSNDKLHVLEIDVSTAQGRDKLLSYIDETFEGKLDILVNNVGTNVRKNSEDFSDSEYEGMMRTNLDSAFHLSRTCLRFLKESKDEESGRGRGCVVNVGSISGLTVDNTGCPYHMAKAAMNHMTRYLACEWGPEYNIRVNCVTPWFIRTQLTEPILKACSNNLRLHF